jgi:hypothetical protein
MKPGSSADTSVVYLLAVINVEVVVFSEQGGGFHKELSDGGPFF